MRLSAPLIGVVLLMVACVALVSWAIIDYATPEVPTATPTVEATEESTPTSIATSEPITETPEAMMEEEPTEEAPMATPIPAEEEMQPAEEMRAEVFMRNTSFQPQEISIQPGTTVVWTNEDGFGHTVTAGTRDSPSGLFDSGNVPGGGSFEFTFDQPGTYSYFCTYHEGMNGTVVVEQ